MPIVKTELKVLKVLELVHKLKLKLIKGKKTVTLTEINEIYDKLDLIYDNMVANRKYNSEANYVDVRASIINPNRQGVRNHDWTDNSISYI